MIKHSKLKFILSTNNLKRKGDYKTVVDYTSMLMNEYKILSVKERLGIMIEYFAELPSSLCWPTVRSYSVVPAPIPRATSRQHPSFTSRAISRAHFHLASEDI